MISDEILQDIKNSACVTDQDLVIEIGPGLGNLTEYLKEFSMLLIEIDPDMVKIIQDRFKMIPILNQDILKIELDNQIEKTEKERNQPFHHVKVVANLPYYITSPILFKLLEDSKRVDEIIVMVQEEVADRMVAKKSSKEYGILTLMIEYFGTCEKLFTVPNHSFIPCPNVQSAVVKIIRKNKSDISYNIFKELVHKAFANRRKKMLNSLEINRFRNWTKQEIIQLMEKCEIEQNTRAEQLEFADYERIVKQIEKSEK